MALRTETIDFEAEKERLREDMDDVAEKMSTFDGQSDKAESLMGRGNQLQRFIDALEWAESEWGMDSIEFASLSAGEVNRVEDTVNDNPTVRHRDAWVAIGTRGAPYVKHDPEEIEQGDYEDSITHLVDTVPLPFIRWAEEQISDLSHLGTDEGNGFLDLVREKRNETT